MLTNQCHDSSIRLVALGGLGEIGLNCLCMETCGQVLVIDCGVSFPNNDLGIDVYHPDFSYFDAMGKHVRAVLITHGHEDHIGAVPYLMQRVRAPVYGSPHALGLIAERLAERSGDGPVPELIPMTSGQLLQFGAFEVEPITVTHSIYGAFALAIQSNQKTIVHTGDFKFDPDPIDGSHTDEARLRQLGDSGVDLLLSDSTNIDTPGQSGSERQVGEALREAVLSCDKRVVIGMFSSNLHRLQMVGDIAVEAGRKITLLGRSVQTQVKVATACKLLNWPTDLLVPAEAVAQQDRRTSLVIAGGTQGEAHAALSRLSTRSHPFLALSPGDLLIMSSRIIPGRDPAVLRVISNFLRQGVHVQNRFSNPEIHVSGHACRDEQQRIIELVRPRHFVPIHGTLHHLTRHAQLAKDLGIGNVLVAENGDILQLDDTGLSRVNYTHVGRIATYRGEPIPENVLNERELVARVGVVMITLFVNSRGHLTAEPLVSARGVIDNGSDESQALAIAKFTELFTSSGFVQQRPTNEQLIEAAERAAQRTFEMLSGRRPVTLVHLVRS